MARQLIIDVVSRTKDFNKGLDGAQGKLKSTAAKMGRVGSKLTRSVTLPIIGIATASVKMASDLGEAMNASDVAFGKNAGRVRRWAKNLDSAFGLTQKEAFDLVSQLRLVTQNSGLTTDQMLKLAERAADVGSVFNMSSQEVGERFRSALTGSTEVVERFGVNIKQGSQGMQDFAASIGKSVSDLTEAEKQQAFYNIIMAETAKAAGDATNTQDTFAGQLRVTKTEAGRLGEEFGQQLIPIGLKVLEQVKGLTTGFTGLSPQVQATIVKVGLLAAVLGPAAKAVQGLSLALAFGGKSLTVALTQVQRHPVIAFITALTLAVIFLRNKFGAFDRMMSKIIPSMDQVGFFFGRLTDNVATFVSWIGTAINFVFGLIDAINRIPGGGILGGAIGRIVGRQTGGIVPGVPGQPTPIIAHGGERILRASEANGGGGGQPIVVQLMLDGRMVAASVVDPVRRQLLRENKRNVNLGLA